MIEIVAITTWFSISGWTRAHQIESRMERGMPAWTLCGREIRSLWVQAADSTPRCGQCLRRRP